MGHKLIPHHLRHERRRGGFTQNDVAWLLGVKTRAKVTRYERGKFQPPLRAALAYEVIFGKPVAKLFEPVFEEVRREVIRRAAVRHASLTELKKSLRVSRRKRSLASLFA